MPYISVNRATRNAVNAPIARQSRPVRGWKKLAANTANNAVLTITSGHSPYVAPASISTAGCVGPRGRVRAATGVAHQRDDAGDHQTPEQQVAHGHQRDAPAAHAVAPVHHRGLRFPPARL